MYKYDALSRTLKALYVTQQEIISLLRRANFEPGDFDLNGRGIVVWINIITLLDQQDRIKQLVAEALKDFPENQVFLDIMNNVDKKKADVYAGKVPDWKMPSTRDTRETQEKIIGSQSTLLPISFLEMGMNKAKPVARVVTPESLGSGFLISKDNLFLTNHHVLENEVMAAGSKLQFNYQKTIAGKIAVFEEFEIDSSVFETSVEDDWTIVKVKGDPVAKYGYLELKPVKTKKDDFVNIIQHPGGEHKQIGMYHNIVAYTDDNIIQYLTDTMPGSSGSPVFNSNWEVVGLHNSGGWIEEPGNGTLFLRNGGININKIISALKAKGYTI